MKHILTATILLISTICCAQKPTPKNDTLPMFKGIIYHNNVILNDIPGIGKTMVTSFTIKSTKYTPGKTASMAGIGSLRIDSSGELLFIPANDTFSGQFPAISYILNNGLIGNGTSAKILLSNTPVEATMHYFQFGRLGGGRIVMYPMGYQSYYGRVMAFYGQGCLPQYFVVLDDKSFDLWEISKEVYDRLK